MERRTLGRTGHQSTVITFGAAGAGTVSQQATDRAMELLLEHGVNHIDIAPTYGEALERLRPWMPKIRDQIFLGSKTTQYETRESAWADIRRCQERLGVETYDLFQLHGGGTTMGHLGAATAPGGGARAHLLIDGRWPDIDPGLADADAKAEMDWVVRMISEIRTVRSEMNVPPGAKLDLVIKDGLPDTLGRLDAHRELLLRLARLDSAAATDGEIPKGSVQAVVDEATLALPLGGVIDVDQEKARLAKDLQKVEGEIGKIQKKLANPGFLAKAPEAVVEEQRERQADYETSRAKLAEAMDRLAAL